MRTYILLVWALWSLVGGLIGVTISVLLGWPFRMSVFLVVSGLGVVSLLTVWLLSRSSGQTSPLKILELPAPDPKRGVKEGQDKETLISPDEILSPERARRWLDEFLVRQQRK